MQLKDVMTRDVEIVQPDTTLQEAAARMRARDIGALPVCDGDRLVGIVTDRDISVRATASGADPKNTFVRTVMTPYPLYCFEDQTVKEPVCSWRSERSARGTRRAAGRTRKLVVIMPRQTTAVSRASWQCWFDGRDITAVLRLHDEVQGYELQWCPWCATPSDPRFPFCCELAGLAPPWRSAAALWTGR
jgi:hypothetical protein